jgi:RHS repeat-associated protein
MRSVLPRLCCALFLLLPCTPVLAQQDPPPDTEPQGATGTDLEPFQEYGKRVKADSTIAPVTSALFGDQVSLYSGGTEFTQVDIDMPGNDVLPVSLGRRFKVEDQRGLGRLYGFGEWDLDIPYVHGMFSVPSGGWRVEGAQPLNRCSSGQPPLNVSGVFELQEFWHGTFLHLPGQGDRELLRNTEAKVPSVTDGNTYPWITRDFFRLRCKTATANGFAGEAFIAVTPSGLTYTFDHWVERSTTSLKKGYIQGPSNTLSRVHIYLLATKIQDQFGNTVTFAYTGDKLQSITASDGRKIALTWTGNKVTGATATDTTPTTAARSWTYGYAAPNVGFPYGQLTSVTLPDTNSVWSFVHTGQPVATPAQQQPQEGQDPSCTEPFVSNKTFPYTLTMTHPAGAQGVFTFEFQRHYRSESPFNCLDVIYPGHQYLQIPNFFDSWTLQSKVISGTALPTMTWSYDYGQVDPYQTAPCTGCQQDKVVTVTSPDLSATAHTFGIAYAKNEGRLLQEAVLAPNASVLRTTSYTYLPDAQVGTQAFADIYGTSQIPNFDPISSRIRPITLRAIAQDGATFSASNSSFDAFARPLQVVKSSTLGYSRTEVTAYHDDRDIWVLGQVASITVGASVPELSTFDAATARPLTKAVFGRLDRTSTWHSNGSLWTIKDGLNHVTTLSSYKRGVPRLIQLPTGVSMSAVVDDHGGITSVTDATGFTTTYGRDNAGRVSSITQPTGDVVGWASTTIAYSKVATSEYGVQAGHWRRTETTDTRKTETFFDALWRPVLERSATTDVSSGIRAVRRAFDHEGREVFVSYPNASLDSINTNNYLTLLTDGTATDYDALGRVTATRTDSELGVLSTATTFPHPFKTSVTNARNYVTTTTYQAFEAPSYEASMVVTAPEGLTTTYTRDVFGKPLTLKRSGPWTGSTCDAEANTICATRRFVYDDKQRLCKTIEPDAGITVLDYDVASNLLWRAVGQATLTSTSDCQRADAVIGERSTHYYDAMNRLLAIDHPAGTDDVGYTYFADGAMQTATTGTLSAASPVAWSPKKTEWTYTYNKRRLLESESLAVDSKTFLLDWTYNLRGDVSNLQYPSSLSVGFNPNAYGEPQQVGTYASGASYHPFGGLAGFTYGNGTLRSITPNDRQLPSQILDSRFGTKLLDHTLRYDNNGNLDRITDGVSGALESRTLSYDGRDRLTSVTLATTGDESYEYDPIDNVRKTVVGGTDRRFVYNATTHRLQNLTTPAGVVKMTYGWNDRGEMTSRIKSTQGIPPVVPPTIFRSGFEENIITTTETFAFDRARRLTTFVGLVTNVYDAHNHRVSTTTPAWGTRYQVYSRGGELLYVEDSGLAERNEYLHLGKLLVAQRSRPMTNETVTTSYLHSDHRGTPSVKSGTTGTVGYRSRLMPYGTPYDGMWRDGPGFTKHATDENASLSYMQQRYYDPETLRFLSPDPIGTGAESFNRYWYANNNPYVFVDPDGRQSRSMRGRPGIQQSRLGDGASIAAGGGQALAPSSSPVGSTNSVRPIPGTSPSPSPSPWAVPFRSLILRSIVMAPLVIGGDSHREDGTRLYRVMGEAEHSQTISNQRYSLAPNGWQEKQFWTTRADAQWFAAAEVAMSPDMGQINRYMVTSLVSRETAQLGTPITDAGHWFLSFNAVGLEAVNFDATQNGGIRTVETYPAGTSE